MAYDEILAERIRTVLHRREGITERSPDGLTPAEQLALINQSVSKLAIDQQAIIAECSFGLTTS